MTGSLSEDSTDLFKSEREMVPGEMFTNLSASKREKIVHLWRCLVM